MRSANGSSLATATRTLMAVIYPKGVTTILIIALGARRFVVTKGPRIQVVHPVTTMFAASPSWYVRRAPNADSESGTTQ